ncbi:hypothetical protein NG827_20090 [Xanthomonas sacchari]|nr:hypothetical protein NG827_20090 [Xanthomonas sacchari]
MRAGSAGHRRAAAGRRCRRACRRRPATGPAALRRVVRLHRARQVAPAGPAGHAAAGRRRGRPRFRRRSHAVAVAAGCARRTGHGLRGAGGAGRRRAPARRGGQPGGAGSARLRPAAPGSAARPAAAGAAPAARRRRSGTARYLEPHPARDRGDARLRRRRRAVPAGAAGSVVDGAVPARKPLTLFLLPPGEGGPEGRMRVG